MAKSFTKGEIVEARLGRMEWVEAEYHHAVDMPPLWLGPRLHVVRMPSGALKSLTAARVRAKGGG